MRLAHVSDLHFYAVPGLGDVLNKRALGLANLYVGGRLKRFGADTVPRLVDDVLAQRPDALAITGDLTAMAHPDEFARAAEALRPLFAAVPVAVIPGNHDVYTTEAARDRNMERVFLPWMAGGRWDPQAHSWLGRAAAASPRWPVLFELPELDLVGVNPCRPSLSAAGRFPPGELDRLEGLIQGRRQAGRCVFLLCHYPIIEPSGLPYTRRGHALFDVDDLIAVLARQPVDAVLHGHEHHGYAVALPVPGGSVPIFNCGSSGYRRSDPERTAGWYLFEVDGGRLVTARRRVLLDDGFAEHPRGDVTPRPASAPG